MIRRSDDKISIRKPSPFNGVGEITVRSLLNGPEEMENKGRVLMYSPAMYTTAAMASAIPSRPSASRSK